MPADRSGPHPDNVAIVGIGCLFPKSPDLGSYWRNIVAGRDCITAVPDDHSWSPADYFDADPAAPDKTWCTRGGFLDKLPFDPMQFGIPPAMLESIDTTQLLSLLVAREALRDAGLDPDGAGWNRDRVSVIIGITGTQEMAITAGARLQGPVWRRSLLRCGVDPALADVIVRDIANQYPTWTEQTFPGLLGNVVAGRIANRLDLGGTNAVVDAACASSLAAMQYAVGDLLAGRSDLVLTGGADTLNDIFMFECFTRTPAFTKRGDARPFDADADGILIGEGIAITALKRLADAERDGDRIYAVLKGLGSSSDGRYKSIYAPNADGQSKALRRTYTQAGFGPETVELVEAHGTGTRAGDAAEIDALKRVYGETGRTGQWAALGSVKAQIGHTKSTAGAAGLVKAALALYARVLPPAAKIDAPNPKMAFDRSPFYLSTRARPWIRAADHPRRAAVSAFGFGGSNFHAVLEEHPGSHAPLAPAETELFLLSGDDDADLVRQLEALRLDATGSAGSLGGPTVTHAARTALAAWRPGRPRVCSFLAGSPDELAKRVATAIGRLGGAAPRPGDDVWIGGGAPGPLAFVFPGQGSQYVEMGRTLAIRHPSVLAALDAADEAFRAADLPPLSSRTFPPPAWSAAETQAQTDALRATAWAQPAIGALSKGMADLLGAFGLRPDVVAGHSYGELVALHVAGVLDPDAFFAASIARGREMGAVGDGTMAAVDGPLDTLAAHLAGTDVVLANRNHPRQGVISGSKGAVRAALERLAAAGLQGRELPVAAAFHSPLVAEARGPFRAVLAALPISAPTLAVLGSDGTPYGTDPDPIRDRLADQLVNPVDWVATVRALVDRGVRTIVEVGPRGVLTGLVEGCLGPDSGVTAVALDRLGEQACGDTQLKRALALLASLGHPIDPAPLLAERAPAAPMVATKANVWIAGANYRTGLEVPVPLLPQRPVQESPMKSSPPASDGWGAVPSSGRPMSRPVHLEHASPAPAPAQLPAPRLPVPVAPAPVPTAPSSDLLALLESTRATLSAFQDAQARTAEVHGKFLDGFARANENFARLFEAQTRLVERAAGLPFQPSFAAPALPLPTVAAPLPAPTFAPAPVPVPVPVPAPTPTPAQSPLDLLTTFGTPSGSRTAVSNDLPPLFDARQAVEARSAPSPARSTAPAFRPDQLKDAVLTAVASKTGYPKDALELGMDLESDLGIDSIKRVEILSAVREATPGLPELDNERLSALRTLADVIASLVGPAPAPAAAPGRGPGREVLVGAMFDAVASKTGYPKDALELGMDLESDLGVDSIKRVEILSAVREAVPGLPELDNERMAALRTLSDVVGYLAESSGGSGPVPDLLAPPSHPPSHDVLVGALLDAVASKTGYPRESLELPMDLETDLGVDSIKRVEILSAVRERLPHLPELDNEVLSSLRRLSDVADHLAGVSAGLGFALIGSRGGSSGSPALLIPPAVAPPPPTPIPGLPPVQSASDLLQAGVPHVPVSLRRRSVSLVDAPGPRPLAPSGRWVITADPGDLARAVARGLSERGIDAVIIDPDWTTDRIDLPAGCSGAVHLAAVGATGAELRRRVRGAFLLARAIGPCARFATVSDRGGRFGRAPATGEALCGALAGLPKTLAHEWPGCAVLALDVGPQIDAARIVDELLSDRGVLEVGLVDAGALTLATTSDDAAVLGELPLAKGDLVVATGGARGVTAASLLVLAKRVPVALLLLGRSAVEPEPDWARGVADDRLVATLLGRVPRPKPREAEAEAAAIRAGREVSATLDGLRRTGSDVHYVAVDGRDADAVRTAIARAVERHGPVRGLVHGAGVLADKRVVDKTPESFDRVFSTKVDGLHALLAAVDPRELRVCVAFTSVAGRFGNAGQVDYAMANEALVHALLALAAQAPGCHCKAIDWGPWDGGMVTPALKAHFAAQGHTVIPLALGARAFVEELVRPGVEVVIEGPRPSTGAIPIRISCDQPWLRDHTIDDAPVVPAAMVLEWMAQLASEVAPGLYVGAIRDLRVLKGVVLDGADRELTLAWEPCGTARAPALQVEVRGPAGVLGLPLPHYRAVIDLVTGQGMGLPAHSAYGDELDDEPYGPSMDEVYRSLLFHGPTFRALESVRGMSDVGATAVVRTSAPAAFGIPAGRWRTDPLAVDALLQLMLLWVREKRGSGALPSTLGVFRWFGTFTGPLVVNLRMERATASGGRFSGTWIDPYGQIVATLDGGEYTASPSLLRTFHAA